MKSIDFYSSESTRRILNRSAEHLCIHCRSIYPVQWRLSINIHTKGKPSMIFLNPIGCSLLRFAFRFFLCTMFLYILVITNTYTTFFATQFTVPIIRPATDHEMFGDQVMEPIKDFGIGDPCLFELTQGESKHWSVTRTLLSLPIRAGLYLRRGCLVACDVAK